RWGTLDNNLSDLFRIAHLPADETQHKLVTMLDQPRRIDEIGALDGVQDIRDGNPHRVEARRIRRDLKFGNAAALYDDGGNAIEAVQARFQVVGGNLPELVRRHGVGSEAVTNDGEDREGQPVRFHFCGGRKVCLQTGDNGVHALQGQNHVGVPVKEEIDFGGTAAGYGRDLLKARNAVYRFFDRTGDGDQHLVDGHDAVVH